MVQFSKGWAIDMVPTISNWTVQNPDVLTKSQMIANKMAAIIPDFRSQSKSRKFATQPLFDHSKPGSVRISDPCCNKPHIHFYLYKLAAPLLFPTLK